MKTLQMAARLTICGVLICSQFSGELYSQSNRSGYDPWARVMALAPQENVEVQREKSGTARGKIVSVDSDSISLSNKNGTVMISKSEVRRVKVGKPASGRGIGMGAAIGVGSGVALAAILDGALTDGNGMSGSAAGFFALVGGLTGFLIPALRSHSYTVYEKGK